MPVTINTNGLLAPFTTTTMSFEIAAVTHPRRRPIRQLQQIILVVALSAGAVHRNVTPIAQHKIPPFPVAQVTAVLVVPPVLANDLGLPPRHSWSRLPSSVATPRSGCILNLF